MSKCGVISGLYIPVLGLSTEIYSVNLRSQSEYRKIRTRNNALRFLYQDYDLSYEELLQKSGKETLKVNRLRSLCTEIYRSINNINPLYVNKIFKFRETSRAVRSNYKLNLDVPAINEVSFADKSLRNYGPKIWNSLPFHIKSSENLEAFKNIIKNWNGVSCKCKVCQYH